MPKPSNRNPRSAPGDWYIDTRCIDCAASREVAPDLIVHLDGKSVFARQPDTELDVRAAWRAALLCPTASIGHPHDAVQPPDLFPEHLDDQVYRCGYNALASFGAHSYWIRRAQGNVLIDSPRFVARLVQAFERAGGLSDILLTHQDDIADAGRYAQRFGARVWIHAWDRGRVALATNVFEGEAVQVIGEDLLVIPLPGHTRGSVAYLWRERFLFTGDSLAWQRTRGELTAFRDVCWYSWSELKRSLARLSQHRFEWVLPGHGHSIHLSADTLQSQLQALIARM
jgi:glyoxylase-like metal-dependent hydrolase (beta-lactamase superfamily II)